MFFHRSGLMIPSTPYQKKYFVLKLSETIFFAQKIKLGAIVKPWPGGVGMISQSLGMEFLHSSCNII